MRAFVSRVSARGTTLGAAPPSYNNDDNYIIGSLLYESLQQKLGLQFTAGLHNDS